MASACPFLQTAAAPQALTTDCANHEPTIIGHAPRHLHCSTHHPYFGLSTDLHSDQPVINTQLEPTPIGFKREGRTKLWLGRCFGGINVPGSLDDIRLPGPGAKTTGKKGKEGVLKK